MNIRLIVSGRNYDMAEAIPSQLALPEGCSVDEALHAIDGLLARPVADSCLIAVSGSHLGTKSCHQGRILREGDELLVLAPIAGG